MADNYYRKKEVRDIVCLLQAAILMSAYLSLKHNLPGKFAKTN